jgi:WD40 repeat protein
MTILAPGNPQVFECPACGASLSLPDADSMECGYCGKTIIIPSNLRPQKPTPDVKVFTGVLDPTNVAWYDALPHVENTIQRANKRTTTILTASVAVAILLVGVIVFILTAIPSSNTSDQSSQFGPVASPYPTDIPFAKLALVFGSKGGQPGQFDDARSIAVDPQGSIFVADYTSGRINKFDPQGNFLQEVRIPSTDQNQDILIFSISTDKLGNLYVAANGSIFIFNCSKGELLQTIPDQWPEIYYDSILVAPDGNLYTTNGMAGSDDVIILSPQGKVLAHWTDVIESINHEDPRIELALGVSHTGMVYLLSPFGDQVYVFNPDGTFNYSFGQEGDNPGQFSLSTGMLAFTAQDYLIISDVYRVDLFESKGSYLGKTFTIDYKIAGGSMYGMTIDQNGDLYYISSGGKVLKFVMHYP